jgi:hypothetical protein
MRVPTWAVTAGRPLIRERVSRAYLYAVAAAVAALLLDTALVSHRQASMTGMLVVLLTLPWTPLLWTLFAGLGGMDTYVTAYGWSGWTLTVLAAAAGAAVNALLLGWAARLARRRVPAR